MDDYKNFDRKWKLIGVRYRKDSGEMRFIYANKIAEKAIQKGMEVYPEGSVFAKIAYLTEPDPAFEASMGPSQTRRFQFMVKNNKLYKEHHGWGYALFNNEGKVNATPVKEQVQACADCHEVVPERDYVFTAPYKKKTSSQPIAKIFSQEIILKSSMPENIQKLLPAQFEKVTRVKSSIIKNVFQGTLDEIKPIIAQISVTQKMPVVFLSEDGKHFSIVYPEDLTVECDDEGAKGLFVVGVHSMPDNQVYKNHFCQSFAN